MEHRNVSAFFVPIYGSEEFGDLVQTLRQMMQGPFVEMDTAVVLTAIKVGLGERIKQKKSWHKDHGGGGKGKGKKRLAKGKKF
ncbi:uncharacterized protein BXZ73DRAFT_103912 [Epithele typhae]|uniref:uncharacterized protein n=1 Tax=Epithele typhae TaxID=378194 RepID=UPI002008E1D7|nr:uncharacterized protein BXZ73DRAFT_103912 [Epithele typhae]KAH9923115.1 hypothetical protein BXZ73DRAFT_103912 [Epithele typhae]